LLRIPPAGVLEGATGLPVGATKPGRSSRSRQICDKGLTITQLAGGIMAEETTEQKLARLEAENQALREQVEQRKTSQLRLKVSEKGGLSLYGLGRFPVTLYKEQWVRLLDYADEIRNFLKANDQQLKAKQ
jgi:hypothetical protein